MKDSDNPVQMSRMQKVALFIIILVAAVLRLFEFSDFSLSNDELSALARLDFDSFYALLMEGIRIDGHPPAAQVILWLTTNLFGNGVFAVRIPFVIAGILSVFFVFRLGKEWISSSAGLLIAALFATLAFPILYSRLARPYALGMLFVSMASFFWIRIIKHNEKPSDYIWLAVSLVLCGFSHYFAALVGVILSVTGIFLVGKSRIVRYVLVLLGGFVLFSPYIPIFLYQLNLGGVGQWLSPPDNAWIWNHLDYAFNNSLLVLNVALAIGILGFALHNPKKNFVDHFLPLLLFLLPFLIGFFYSRWVNPVLQNSTLLFSFPFLLIFLFSGWKDSRKPIAIACATVLTLTTLFSTAVQNKFFQTNHFGVFKELAIHLTDWNSNLENDAVLIGDYNSPFYIQYYLDRIDSTRLDLYRTSDEEGLKNLKQLISASTKSSAIYSWSTISQLPEIQEIIKDQFYSETKRETYFNSQAVMFARSPRPEPSASFNFKKESVWNLNPANVLKDSISGFKIIVDRKSPYGPTFEKSMDELLTNGVGEIVTRIEFNGLQPSTSVQIVCEQVNEEGGYAWESDKLGLQVITSGSDWAVSNYRLKENDNPGKLKIYPWSPNGEDFSISKMEIWFR